MKCFESRRRLLAAPRERSTDHDAHIAECPACSRLATDVAALDRTMIKATRTAVPDGLADRIMIARRYPGRSRYAAGIAAAVLVFAIAGVTLFPMILESDEPTLAADSVGPTHPAVAAITMVANRDPALLKDLTAADGPAVEDRLKFLGLALKSKGISARYLGKCEVAGRECDHLVLDTRDGQVNVFLMANERAPGRLMVADQRMTALLSPAPTGALIVVAESPTAARRVRKLFVHG